MFSHFPFIGGGILWPLQLKGKLVCQSGAGKSVYFMYLLCWTIPGGANYKYMNRRRAKIRTLNLPLQISRGRLKSSGLNMLLPFEFQAGSKNRRGLFSCSNLILARFLKHSNLLEMAEISLEQLTCEIAAPRIFVLASADLASDPGLNMICIWTLPPWHIFETISKAIHPRNVSMQCK